MLNELNIKVLEAFIKDRHKEYTVKYSEMDKYKRYYNGEHDIIKRQPKSETTPNNQVVLNYCKLIVDTNWNYLYGKNISYDTSKDDKLTKLFQEKLIDIFFRNDEPVVSSHIGKEAAVLSYGVEVMYIDDVTKEIKFKRSNPMDWAFYELNNEQHALHVVNTHEYVFTEKGYERLPLIKYEIYTPTQILKYKDVAGKFVEDGIIDHYFGETPVTIYYNEANLGGEGDSDIKHVINLNDALNTTNSDLQNIIETNASPILLLKNLNIDLTNLEEMKKNRILSFTSDPQVQSEIKNHIYDGNLDYVRDHIGFLVQNILILSFTPDLFSQEGQKLGVQSADSVRLKMHSTESKTSGKIISFEKGLRKRIRMIAKQLEMAGQGNFYTTRVYEDITIGFNKTIPYNIGSIIESLTKGVGLFSKHTLLSQAPFVEDAGEELQKRKDEDEIELDIDFGDDVINE